MNCLFSRKEKVKIIDYVDRFGKKHYTYKLMLIPCGKCIACRLNKAYDWETRVLAEMEICYSVSFVTLTYEDSQIPMKEGVCCFSKTDVQNFFKRLRNHVVNHYENSLSSPPNLRYLLVSEHGDVFGRPHYHIILFNLPYAKDFIKQADILNSCWSKGFVTCAPVSRARVRYLLIYFTKSQEIPYRFEEEKPFLLSSRNPALGRTYLDSNSAAVTAYKQNLTNDFYVGSLKRKMPLYFRNKIYNDKEKKYINKLNELKHESKEFTLVEYLANIERSYKSSLSILQKRFHETQGRLKDDYALQIENLNKQYQHLRKEHESLIEVESDYYSPYLYKQQKKQEYAKFKSRSFRSS